MHYVLLKSFGSPPRKFLKIRHGPIGISCNTLVHASCFRSNFRIICVIVIVNVQYLVITFGPSPACQRLLVLSHAVTLHYRSIVFFFIISCSCSRIECRCREFRFFPVHLLTPKTLFSTPVSTQPRDHQKVFWYFYLLLSARESPQWVRRTKRLHSLFLG